jgi:glycosyltransferase involved in cell wall biosynthesis
VIVVEHSHAARIAPILGLPWLLDEHNIESGYVADAARARGRTVTPAESAALSVWEQDLWTSATEVSCTSDADADRIAAVRGRRPIVVPNGVDVRWIPFHLPSDRTSDDVLFVGSMLHPPNVHACRMLAGEVMPLVWEAVPRARLVLCGANPVREVRRLAGDRIVVTGTVPSVLPFLEQSAVYANALEHGAGSSLKVAEALAAGVPMVSTGAGVRGHPLVPGTHYLPAANPSEMADGLIRILRNRADYDAMSTHGRQVALTLDWSPIGRRFASAIEGLLASSGVT